MRGIDRCVGGVEDMYLKIIMEDGQRHRRSSNGGYNRERGPAERDRGRYSRNGRGRPRERERERPRGGRGKVFRLDQETCLFHWYMNFL